MVDLRRPLRYGRQTLQLPPLPNNLTAYVSLPGVCVSRLLCHVARTHTDLFEDEEEEEEDEDLGFAGSLGWMAILTIFISILSEYLVEAIEPTSKDWGVPYLFIGVILIPIVGNAAEHATAVVMAYKNKMEITMGVAVGSSVQVAVFVIPFMVRARTHAVEFL